MRTPPLASGLCCLAVILMAATPALCAAKHFRASVDHFRECGAKAAELYFKAETSGERHILGHLTSIAAVYAEKAATIMYLVEIQEHMSAKRDRLYVADRLREARQFCVSTLSQDIKLLADLVEAQENQTIQALGNLIVNELRVFERNLDIL